MKAVIFYSWQSDRPSRINRNCILSAAEAATTRVRADNDILVEPVIDRDTSGQPGSPAIAQTILEKIESCNLFLADVTFINDSTITGRQIPNPNVLIELGYAAAKLGWERVICVMNEAYGTPNDLPFDLQHRRWPIRYMLSADCNEMEKRKVQQKLSEEIEYAIRVTIQNGVIFRTPNPRDKRVAQLFYHAISSFWGSMSAYLKAIQMTESIGLLFVDFDDEDQERYPTPTAADNLVLAFTQWKPRSVIYIPNGKPRGTWASILLNGLQELERRCIDLSHKYSERDDLLVDAIEDINFRVRDVQNVITGSFTIDDQVVPYDEFSIEAYQETLRYFFLAILKSARICRQFTVITNNTG